MRRPTIQHMLSALVLACALPAVLGFALLTRHFYLRELEQIKNDSMIAARAIMQAVDHDLDLGIIAAQSLAMASELDRQDFAGFYGKAQSVLAEGFHGSNFVLSTRDSIQILNTQRPYGAPIPDPASQLRIRHVFETAQPMISDVFVGGATGRPLVAVHVPVLRNGQVRYVLSVGFLPQQLARALQKQRLPASRVAGIFDRTGVLIARNWEPEKYVGKPGSPELVQRMKESDEAVVESVTLEGVPVYSMFSRSAHSGWSVAIGVPRASVLHEVLSSLMWLTWLGIVLLLIGFGTAWHIGRRISRSVRALSDAAKWIGTDKQGVWQPSTVRETEAVAKTLQQVGNELTTYRQHLEALIQRRTEQLQQANTQLAQARDDAESTNVLLREVGKQASSRELRIRAVVENVGEGIITIDEHGVIETFNRAATDIFGYSAQEIIGSNITRLMPEEMRAAHTKGLRRYVGGGPAQIIGKTRIELPALRQDGARITVELTVSAVEAGEKLLFVGILRDVTEHRKVQAELRQAVADARAADSAKSAFLANMSHELRTPMNAVLGMAHLIGMAALSTDQRRHLEMLRGAGKSLLALLNDILDLSKIEAGKATQTSVPFELEAVLQAVATIMGINANDKPLELCIGVDADVPGALIGDPVHLQQILVNLTGNAIKFTTQGEVTLSIQCEEKQLDQVKLRFVIRDTGIGVPKEQQQKLFNPFVQVDATTTREFGGTGLGLVICKRLAELQGGRITLDSSPGIGSTFTLTLPFHTAEPTATPPRASIRKRILVLENNATARAYLNQALEASGWHADIVSSSDEADRIFQFAPRNMQYDLVLADWSVPYHDQQTILQWRASTPHGIPVVLMMSASDRSKMAQSNPAADLAGVVTKPVLPGSLCDVLNETLVRAASPLSEAPVEPPSYHIRGRLLLVEDNPMNQLVAIGILERSGATVDVVSNGGEAVKVLRANPQAYQLILMDIQMPVMDGYTATRVLRNELGLRVPIVAMTAGVMEAERAACLAAGMTDFIAKPLDVDEMLSTIEKHLALSSENSKTFGD